MTLRLGTRGSQLALWQARTVAGLLQERGIACELVIIRTSGDQPPDPPVAVQPDVRRGEPSEALTLRQAQGHPEHGRGVSAPSGESKGGPPTPASDNIKRMFVKEIEEALLEGRIDLAVHSSKDLPVLVPDGLVIAGVLPREDPRDAILLPRGEQVADIEALRTQLGSQPRLGTSSVRRVAQLRALLPGATFAPIRGNVDTRIRKLDAGECDAIVLACAGLKRLGLHGRISLALPVEVSIPAPGQGIVAIEVRADRPDVASAIETIGDAEAMDALTAERAIVSALGGGCQMPLGAYARIDAAELQVEAVVIAPDASRVIRESGSGPRTDAAELGMRIADALLQQGAGAILSNGA